MQKLVHQLAHRPLLALAVTVVNKGLSCKIQGRPPKKPTPSPGNMALFKGLVTISLP